MNAARRTSTATDGFAKRLRALRLSHDLSQKQLGEQAGLHHTHISRYENGTSRPTADALKRLADVLEVPGDYLLDGDVGPDRLRNEELLRRFQRVVQLPEADQSVIMQILDAFLLRRDLEQALQKVTPGS
jgi:transcriptional regulator with XRE-family HTH domain